MSSGFSGGDPDFYFPGGLTGRSVSMNGNAQYPYRSQLQKQQQQLQAGIILDPPSNPSQILHRRSDLIGKRPVPEFQAQNHNHYLLHHYQQQQQGINGLFLRSVKPRILHQASPISPLPPGDLSSAANAMSPELSCTSQSPAASSSSRLRPADCLPPITKFATTESDPDPEKKMMNRLQELEKQLLDDDDDEEAVSVVTNSEWSDTVQTLMTPTTTNQNSAAVSPSPASSTSSSNSSAASSPPTAPQESLMAAATAISEGNPETALAILTRTSQDSNGGSDQRVAAYIAAALRRRVSGAGDEGAVGLSGAMQVLCEISPCFNLGLLAANHAILDATSDLPEKIHLIDFDGGACVVQCLSLVLAMEARAGGKPVALKITSVVAEPNGPDERLRKLCERTGSVSVKVGAVSQGASGLTRDSLGCEPDEAVVVNLAFKLYRMPDESVRMDNPRDELLRRVRSLRPRVVTVLEQEMNCNTAPFSARVMEAHAYYSALFDSIESAGPRDHPDRVRLEEGLRKKMANSVACEGMDRVERCEMFGKWRARLRMAGFEPRPLCQGLANSLQGRVNSETRGGAGFSVKEENGGIGFGWKGRTLAVASAWR